MNNENESKCIKTVKMNRNELEAVKTNEMYKNKTNHTQLIEINSDLLRSSKKTQHQIK